MANNRLPPLGRHPRMLLFDGPTPIQRLDRLEAALGDALGGVRLYVKRDDLMGLGGGGNKLRKLEFLLGEARQQGADTFLTVGGLQSNHARLSAAAATRAGLACELFLSRQVPLDDPDYDTNGNLLLDAIFGARIHRLSATADPLAAARERAEEVRSAGGSPYVVGAGGSSPVGCLGYAVCAEEIAWQEQELGVVFRRIVVANGSSGTQAGLLAGFAAMGMEREVVGYAVLAPEAEARETTAAKALACLTLLDASRELDISAVKLDGTQRGDSYGVPTDAMVSAVRLLARAEGLLLDPVYTGKAFAGLLASIRDRGFRSGDALLFIMTGGSPGLFAYKSVFQG